ncbi:hypothetical protein HYS31_05340 [Candidatus Woesearchaeota archaeon]|nr:hypothetical protein [Candidatus Woesearchaeota archaeon]
MKPNPKVQRLYELHTKHLDRDARHLGDAENLQELIEYTERNKPAAYMLAKCCTDGTPTLQLAYRPATAGSKITVRRVRLGMLSDQERLKLVQILERESVPFRQTSYLSLNSDFTETESCRKQERLSLYYQVAMKILELWNRAAH